MKFENTEVFNIKGALRGMRNPMNSWEKSDSGICKGGDDGIGCDNCCEQSHCNHCYDREFKVGKEDMVLAQRLIKAGSEHRKFMRMIHVSVDVDMPRYWWSEQDTYHFNTKNSCSTMHKLLNNTSPITKDLFVYCEEDVDIVDMVVERLEMLREQYKNEKDYAVKTRLLVRAKRLLMEGFLQLRTLDTNYEELRTEYFQRRNHRLKEEWQDTFCRWVESLPYAKELITYEGETNK